VLEVHRNRIMRRHTRGLGAPRRAAKAANANQHRGGKRPDQKTVHARILRISPRNAVSIFHPRQAPQPAILANPTALADYDVHRPDLIQLNTKKGGILTASTGVRGRAEPSKKV